MLFCVRRNRKNTARSLKITSRPLLLSLFHTQDSEFLFFLKVKWIILDEPGQVTGLINCCVYFCSYFPFVHAFLYLLYLYLKLQAQPHFKGVLMTPALLVPLPPKKQNQDQIQKQRILHLKITLVLFQWCHFYRLTANNIPSAGRLLLQEASFPGAPVNHPDPHPIPLLHRRCL